jgi:hypothetical protein
VKSFEYTVAPVTVVPLIRTVAEPEASAHIQPPATPAEAVVVGVVTVTAVTWGVYLPVSGATVYPIWFPAASYENATKPVAVVAFLGLTARPVAVVVLCC